MTPDTPEKLTRHLIEKNQWDEILQRFIDVLRINIFMVDAKGRTIIPPQKGRYGWKLLSSSSIGMELLGEHSSFLEKFKKHGFYLEYNYLFDLHSFAIPINVSDNKTIAYLIIGPVILNKRLERSEYRKIAEKLRVDAKDFIDSISEIRVLTFVGIKSILDLLDETASYIVDLKMQQRTLHKKRFKKELLPERLRDMAENLYSSIFTDELLVDFLNAALKFTNAECGSVMLIDNESGDLCIRVSRGINDDIAQKTCVKVGDGIAGLCAREGKSFIINGNECSDEAIRPYLKRPDIKRALTAPLISQDKIFGVVNLHSKSNDSVLGEGSLDTVQTLSQLTSAAIRSLQV